MVKLLAAKMMVVVENQSTSLEPTWREVLCLLIRNLVCAVRYVLRRTSAPEFDKNAFATAIKVASYSYIHNAAGN